MRFRLGELKRLVREAAMTAGTVPHDVGLIVKESRGHVTLALVRLPDIERALSGHAQAVPEQAVVGSINVHMFDVWRVTNVRSMRGYGPLLYRLAMQYATQHGSALSSDPDGQTSPAAQAVWDRFAEQPDVETIFLDEEHGDQRDIAYQLEGDDGAELARRYESLLAGLDRSSRDRLDELIDDALWVAMSAAG